MEELKFPVWVVPELPEKHIPWEAFLELNADFVRRLKESGLYERIRSSPMYQPVSAPFRLD